MARRENGVGLRPRVHVTVPMSPEEAREITTAAKKAGVPRAAFMRGVALDRARRSAANAAAKVAGASDAAA